MGSVALDTSILDPPVAGRPEPGQPLFRPETGRNRQATGRHGRGLLRSAGVRFAVLYAALFGISALALALFLWWATAGLLDRQVDAAIRADAQGLREQWDGGGLPDLVVTIRDRLAGNVDDDAIYLL